MTVDRKQRDQLAVALRRLVTGRRTNNAFDDSYYENWQDSQDAAISEIAEFGYGLYSSDLWLPYKLKGRHAVPAAVRQKAARAILFLRSDLRYAWPCDVQGVVPFWCLWGPGSYLIVGVLVFWAGTVTGGTRGLLYGIFGGLAIVPSIHWLLTYRKRSDQVKKFRESGDPDYWPFLNRTDFDRARQKPAAIQGETQP